MSNTDPYANLSQNVLNQIYGLLEPFEGFGGNQRGFLYFVIDGEARPVVSGMTVQADITTDVGGVMKYLDEGLTVR